jgi:hypothetical protein
MVTTKHSMWHVISFMVLVFGLVLILTVGRTSVPLITNFNECVLAGNPVLESYPRQCKHENKMFIEVIGNELAKAGVIKVDAPRPNQKIQSPLTVKGQARGNWFFEASFPIRLIDFYGNNIALEPAYIMTSEEWMTSEFVSFEATIDFSIDTKINGNAGTLILQKDNPSGLSEHDEQLVIPVVF